MTATSTPWPHAPTRSAGTTSTPSGCDASLDAAARGHDARQTRRRVSAQEVDEYLRGIEEPKRRALETRRRTILEIVPEAEQVISYRVPAFAWTGRRRRLRRLQGPPELPA